MTAPPRLPRRKATFTRTAFYVHLWAGVILTIALIAISVTGILLNHKRGLGFMPQVDHSPTAPFATALSLGALADTAMRQLPHVAGAPDARAQVDRMDVRPRDGIVKVRMRDSASTEVTLDISTGRVLHVGPRGDVFLEKLHSGEIFGSRGILLSDFAAIGLVLTLITGYWLWLAPKRSQAKDGDA